MHFSHLKWAIYTVNVDQFICCFSLTVISLAHFLLGSVDRLGQGSSLESFLQSKLHRSSKSVLEVKVASCFLGVVQERSMLL